MQYWSLGNGIAAVAFLQASAFALGVGGSTEFRNVLKQFVGWAYLGFIATYCFATSLVILCYLGERRLTLATGMASAPGGTDLLIISIWAMIGRLVVVVGGFVTSIYVTIWARHEQVPVFVRDPYYASRKTFRKLMRTAAKHAGLFRSRMEQARGGTSRHDGRRATRSRS
jgi:hypothetical protein